MNSQELKLDHFKLYDVANLPTGIVVGLQGQFDEQPEKVKLTTLSYFANPVSKNKEPIYDEHAHLTWYDLYDPVPDPIRVVAINNQFGEDKIKTGKSVSLLSPAQKFESGSEFPERLDHYKTYEVLSGKPVNKEVLLKDQFGLEENKVYHPVLFGVPVKKWWEGQEFGITNERTHLVFYRINPAPFEKTIRVRDQFGQRYLHVVRSVLLAVPTVKLDWSTT